MIAQSPLARRIDDRANPTAARPEDLIYAVDELPPWSHLIFLGAAAALMSVYLVLIVLEFESRTSRSPNLEKLDAEYGIGLLASG